MDKYTRKRKTKNPCPICALHLQRCICTSIPHLDLKTKVTLLIHAKELKRTTNSGRLAMHALTNSKMLVRGEIGGQSDLSELLSPDYESCVLYPSADAIELDDFKSEKPIQLIVSDGNWRQASKINTRHPELSHLPRVKVTRPGAPAEHHLRKEHFSEGMSTLEAIARALTVLEGHTVGAQLMALYQAKLHATVEGRGIFSLN